jgi:hypothetical protein
MRRIVSLTLTASFAATAITGLLMLSAHIRVIRSAHEVMAVTFTVASVFHIVLNARCLGGYIKEKPALASVLLALTVAITLFVVVTNPHGEQNRHRHPFQQSGSLDRE